MIAFSVQHIDALIATAAGIGGCLMGFRSHRTATTRQQRAAKILRICGPLVILFGLLSFFIGQPAAPDWQRHLTSDGFASAEFPAPPQASQQLDTVNGVSAERTTLNYNVPFKDISLFLSFSPIPPNEANVSDNERIAGMKAGFMQKGFSVVRESPAQFGAASGFALDLQRDAGRIRMWLRVACVAGRIYRVVVASAGSHHDDPIITRYLESFRIERTEA